MAGKLYCIGIGPGNIKTLTKEAEQLLEECDVIAGFSSYTEQIREAFPGKDYRITGMGGEEDRCRSAFEEAAKGKTAAVISGGDPGIYGMAGLVLSLKEEYPDVSVRVIPGVTAACSGAALLGAPLGHDFAVISLSDYLTPREKIEKRLHLAAEADFCIVIYNPSSHSRPEHFKKACEILLQVLPGDRVCGLARRIGREGEETEICLLKDLPEKETDMVTTIFIGNSETFQNKETMITPRIKPAGKRHQ